MRLDCMQGGRTQEDVQAICSPFAETMLEGLTCSDRRDLTRLFPTASEEAADLLARLLHFKPQQAHHGRRGAGAPLCGAVPLPCGGALCPWGHHHLHR